MIKLAKRAAILFTVDRNCDVAIKIDVDVPPQVGYFPLYPAGYSNLGIGSLRTSTG